MWLQGKDFMCKKVDGIDYIFGKFFLSLHEISIVEMRKQNNISPSSAEYCPMQYSRCYFSASITISHNDVTTVFIC